MLRASTAVCRIAWLRRLIYIFWWRAKVWSVRNNRVWFYGERISTDNLSRNHVGNTDFKICFGFFKPLVNRPWMSLLKRFIPHQLNLELLVLHRHTFYDGERSVV